MNVYVLVKVDWDSYDVLGVFSSLEKAEAAAPSPLPLDYGVDAYELDVLADRT